jgi:hypothetical protein
MAGSPLVDKIPVTPLGVGGFRARPAASSPARSADGLESQGRCDKLTGMEISLVALLGGVVPLAVLGAAIVLRAACSLCHFTPPGYPRALKTVALGCLVGAVVWAVPTLLIQGGNLEIGPPLGLASQLIIGLITFLATGAVYAASLKTSFDQAILIRLAETGLVVGIGLLAGSAAALGIKEGLIA